MDMDQFGASEQECESLDQSENSVLNAAAKLLPEQEIVSEPAGKPEANILANCKK